MSTYAERAVHHRNLAFLHIESARDHSSEGHYGLAAADLRAATEAMERAAEEQYQLDLVLSAQDRKQQGER